MLESFADELHNYIEHSTHPNHHEEFSICHRNKFECTYERIPLYLAGVTLRPFLL